MRGNFILFYLIFFYFDSTVSFPLLFLRFSVNDLQKFCVVMKNAVAVPVHGESTPYILPTIPDVVLTQLQDGVLHSIEMLQKVIVNNWNLGYWSNRWNVLIYLRLLVSGSIEWSK